MSVRIARRGAIAASIAAAGGGGALPVYRAAVGGGTSGFQTSANVTIPAGVQAGDMMILAVSNLADSAQTINTPSGWTLVRSDTGTGGTYTLRLTIFKKTATGGDPGATLTVTASASATFRVGIVAYSGATTVGPDAAQGTSSSTINMTAPAVTAVANTVVMRIYGHGLGSPTDDDITGPATQRVDSHAAWVGLYIGDADQAGAGTTGTAAATGWTNGSGVGTTVAVSA